MIGSRVPFRNALIPHEKIVHYLLDLQHPDGGSKAKYFLAQGFRSENPKVFADALFEHIVENPVASVRHGRYGAQLAVKGLMSMPNGTRRVVLSVWLLQDTGDGIFITAYPQEQA